MATQALESRNIIAETAILTAFIPLKKTGIFSMLTHIYSARGVKKRVDPYKANK